MNLVIISEQHQSQINSMLHAMPSIVDEEVKYSPIYGLVPDSEVATSPALRYVAMLKSVIWQ